MFCYGRRRRRRQSAKKKKKSTVKDEQKLADEFGAYIHVDSSDRI